MNAVEQDGPDGREDSFERVSLQAVELLAKAQRAADEAVAEAQSYARDLEESAREQYRQILLRAQSAAQEHPSAREPAGGGAQAAKREERGTLDSEKLLYVRTYARVAHAQLKSVLGVLNEELDQLAAMAQGDPGSGGLATVASPALGTQPVEPRGQAGVSAAPAAVAYPEGADRFGSGGASPKPASSTDEDWTPIFAATNAISYVYRGPALEGPYPQG